jgi:DNA mismatch repair ATPase MutS
MDKDKNTDKNKNKDKNKDKNKEKEKDADKNDDKEKCGFKNAYYPALIHEKPIKNSFKFDKNMIVTGPNASGKTTILKSALINVILTQQFGCGFYDSAVLVPFKYIHCYLNIPDTSGRDSLFQAESRKCKEMIKLINKHPTDRHFCVFDELYSGTNYEEATKCGYAFLLYLSKYKTTNFLLTTHYLNVCEKLDNHKNIQNYKMCVGKNENDGLIYKYKIERGITNIKGGIEVLKQMKYPDEIMQTIKNLD